MRQAKVATLLIGVALGCCSVSRAQLSLHRQTLSTWNIEQGLPQSFVTALDQTPDGFLWVGTMGGLARFDGLNFRKVFPGDPSALHAHVQSIGHNNAGDLWVGTSSGLLKETRGKFHLISLPEHGPQYVLQMVVSRDGGVWVNTGQHLWKLDSDEKTFHLINIESARIRTYTEDSAGSLWIVTGRSVIVQQAGGQTDEYPLKDAEFITKGGDGQIYIGDRHSFFRLLQGKFARSPSTPFAELSSMMAARDGSFWLASGGQEGIARQDSQGVQKLTMADGLTSNHATVLMEDHTNGVWIGTVSGLQWVHQGAFTSFGARDGLPPPGAQYDAIFASAHGEVWTGTVQDGIAVLRNDRWQTFGTKSGLPRGQIRGFADDDGPMPFVALETLGLYRWNGTRYLPIPGVPTGPVTNPIRARDGSVWFSVLRSGVFRLKGQVLTHFAAAEGLTDLAVWSLLDDGADGMYAGSPSGLFHFKGSRWKAVHPEIHSFVSAVKISKHGELLLGTASGLQVVKGESVTTIAHAQGLMANGVYGIAEDAEGSLWLANPLGISRLPRKQLNDFLNHKAATVSPELYTERDGLPFRELLPMGGDALLTQSRDGRLWVATERGPSVWAGKREFPPTAVVDSISVDGIVQLQGDPLVTPGRHRVAFSFTAPNFAAPEQMRFRYRLLGWDPAWIDAGDLRDITYAGLLPGTYHFQVQAIGRGGNEGPVIDGAVVELRPFWWQTRGFLVVISALAIALVVELTRRSTLWRARRATRRFEEHAAERERIAYQIHDTVIQELIGATLHMEIAEMELVTRQVDPLQQLEELTERLRETVARSRNMVASLQSTPQPIEGLLKVLRLAEDEFRLKEQPEFILTHTGTPYILDPLLHEDVYRICREAIANAFRHSNAEHVHVHVNFERDVLHVKISDDGNGMNRELQQKGRKAHLGLASMRARSRRIGAELTIESTSGIGTTLELYVRTSWLQRMFRRPFQQHGSQTQDSGTAIPGESLGKNADLPF